jgi:DNA modification methylase
METNVIHAGDALEVLRRLPEGSVDCCVTSPPYFGLRDYGVSGQIGLENTPQAYVERLVAVLDEVHRVLKKEGTFWLNLGDSYAGSGRGQGNVNVKGIQSPACFSTPAFNKPYRIPGCKGKDLIGIPWMVAFALRERGWYLRQEIIWAKPNPMPESVRDRCTKSHESIFLLTKSPRYYFDRLAVMEPAKYDGRRDTRAKGSHKYSQLGTTGLHPQTFSAREHERWVMHEGQYMRNRRDVWTVPTRGFKGAHFATFPPELVRPCILAGCPEDGVVLDPFFGAGTTGLVAMELGRRYIGIDLSEEYCRMAFERLSKAVQKPFKEAS